LKLAFFGSRSLRIRRKEVLKIIEMEIEKHNPEMVITSGAPEGVCKLVKYYCINNGITRKENIDANIDQFDIGNNLNELNNTEEVLNI